MISPSLVLIIQRSVASLGTLSNLILILLIIFKSPKQLGHYKYLMGYISVFEIFYSMLDFISEIVTIDSLFLIVVHKSSGMVPDSCLKYLDYAFCSLFGMSMAIFAIHFVYRYLVITGSRFLQNKHLMKVFGLIGFTIMVGILWNLIVHIFLNSNPYSDIKLSKDYLTPRHLNLSDVVYVGAHFHQIDKNGVQFVNWTSMGAVGMMTVVIFISISIVFYCGYQIYTRMEAMTSLQSSGTKNLQSQLFWALVFQTLIPIMLMHIPASMGFITAMLNITTKLLGQMATHTIFMYPALDPLPNFFIIKCFRQAILEFFGCNRKNTVPSNSKMTNSQKAVSDRAITT